ncbi:MAG: benzoate-CoA ligase family protein [Myxococcota bacterium]
MSLASIDLQASPPHVHFPRPYNAAVDLLERHRHSGRTAFIDDRQRLSFAALAERADQAGRALLHLGLEPEQRVVMAMLDTVDFPAVFLGAIKAGLVPVPVNTLLGVDDYAYFLEDSRAKALVVSDYLLPKLAPAAARQGQALRGVLVGKTALGGPEGHSFLSLDAALDAQRGPLEPARTSADEVAFWLYSSGSTGAPKGTLHLQGSLQYTAALYARGILGLGPDDVVFSAAKLFFAYGLGNSLTFPLSVGAQSVLMAERSTPQAVSRVMTEAKPTIFCGVPTLFASMLADPGFGPARSSPALRLSTSAGEALPKHVGERWRERLGTDILDGIGSTEMLHIFLSNRRGDVAYGTSGRPVPGYELDLRSDGGGPTADGEEGSLWVRGPSAASGYFANREKTLATFHGPWTRTGDRYLRDSDGRYTYCGRADDMLKVGGIWVSPFEVESALARHPEVLEAAVVGGTDAEGLVKPKAFVVLKPGAVASEALADALKVFVKTELAPYKYPRWIVFKDELPKTATGKIQRFRLREE